MPTLDSFRQLWAQQGMAPAVAAPAARAPSRRSGPYVGASNDRLVADMLASVGVMSANAELRMSLRALRQNSRYLFRNNEYARAFARLLRNNVAGPHGFKFQSKVRKVRGAFDEVANDLIEGEFENFSKRGNFTADGMLSRSQVERSLAVDLARDGEYLIELALGFKNRWGFAVRRIDVDLLDDTLNVPFGGSGPGGVYLGTDSEIRMGVERDRWGRPVAYWFLNAQPGDDMPRSIPSSHRRITADRIIHRFLAEDERPGAVRGVPLVTPAIRRMAMLGGYEDAALVAARAGAAKMAFYTQPVDERSNENLVADDTDANGDLIQEFAPGTMGVLPPGWEIQTFDPTYPNEKFDVFVKRMLRAFAAGVGVGYNAVSSDLEGVNLSSLRYGVQDDRDQYETLRDVVVEDMTTIFTRWLEYALDFGAIGTLPADPQTRARLTAPSFIGRGWKYMDPKTEIEADEKAVALGIKAPSDITAERGQDYEEVQQRIQRDREVALRYGNTPAGAATKAPKPAAPAATPTAEEPDEPAEGEGKPTQEDGEDAAA